MSNKVRRDRSYRLDGMVCASLCKIAGPSGSIDSDWEDPPAGVLSHIEEATEKQALGVLIHALRRWHSLRAE
ncbi:hypothetical protein [Posidoniimonas corsicana]|nr:hypothetical protein [Posidoniimonas corsicana]